MVWQVEIQGSGGSPSTVDNPVPGVAPSPGVSSVSSMLAGAGGPAPQGNSSGGNVGGSLVGRDPAADQWVRDLIEQQLGETSIINLLKGNIGSSSGDTLIAEFFNSDDVVLISNGSSPPNSVTVTGQNRTVKFDGKPMRFLIGADFIIGYDSVTGDPFPFHAEVTPTMNVYIDGTHVLSLQVQIQNIVQDVSHENIGVVSGILTLRDTILLSADKRVDSYGLSVSAATMAGLITSGNHTVRVDCGGVWTDADFIQIEMRNEYFSFYKADSSKYTVGQDFDATTIL